MQFTDNVTIQGKLRHKGYWATPKKSRGRTKLRYFKIVNTILEATEAAVLYGDFNISAAVALLSAELAGLGMGLFCSNALRFQL